MVRVKKISISVIGQYVAIAFKDDKELSLFYHDMKDPTIEKCVVDAVIRIFQLSEQRELSYYKVMNNKVPIGFFVLGSNFLQGFGIDIKFRNKEILTQWFNIVKKLMHNSFFTVLDSKNTRAINFLKRQGMKAENDENNLVTLIYT